MARACYGAAAACGCISVLYHAPGQATHNQRWCSAFCVAWRGAVRLFAACFCSAHPCCAGIVALPRGAGQAAIDGRPAGIDEIATEQPVCGLLGIVC